MIKRYNIIKEAGNITQIPDCNVIQTLKGRSMYAELNKQEYEDKNPQYQRY